MPSTNSRDFTTHHGRAQHALGPPSLPARRRPVENLPPSGTRTFSASASRIDRILRRPGGDRHREHAAVRGGADQDPASCKSSRLEYQTATEPVRPSKAGRPTNCSWVSSGHHCSAAQRRMDRAQFFRVRVDRQVPPGGLYQRTTNPELLSLPCARPTPISPEPGSGSTTGAREASPHDPTRARQLGSNRSCATGNINRTADRSARSVAVPPPPR